MSKRGFSSTYYSGCFKHCGFVKESSIEHGDENVSTHDKDMSELNEVIASVSNEVSLDDYLEVDEQVVTAEFMSDDDIMESIQDTNSNLDNMVMLKNHVIWLP